MARKRARSSAVSAFLLTHEDHKLLQRILGRERNGEFESQRTPNANNFADEAMASGNYVVKIPSSGMPARVGTSPGVVECGIHQVDDDNIIEESPTFEREVYNLSLSGLPGTSDSGGDLYVPVLKDSYGRLFAVASAGIEDIAEASGTGTGGGAGGFDLASRSTTGLIDHGENTTITEGAQELRGVKAFIMPIIVGPQVPIGPGGASDSYNTGGTIAFEPLSNIPTNSTYPASQNYGRFVTSRISKCQLRGGGTGGVGNVVDIYTEDPSDSDHWSSFAIVGGAGPSDFPSINMYCTFDGGGSGATIVSQIDLTSTTFRAGYYPLAPYSAGRAYFHAGMLSDFSASESHAAVVANVGSSTHQVYVDSMGIYIQGNTLKVYNQTGTLQGTGQSTTVSGLTFFNGIYLSGSVTITVSSISDFTTGVQATAYYPSGTDVALADGGTGASLADPGDDRILFWDDSAGAVTWLEVGTGLSISGTTLSASGGSFQPLDATLTALAAFNTNGLLVQTAADTFAGRTLAAPAAGFTITNPDGTAGNPTFVLSHDLGALEALTGTNTIYYRSGTSTWTAVTIDPSLTFSSGTLSGTAASLSQAGVIAVANETDMETANSTTVAVTPNQFHNHPACPKAWAFGTTSGGTPSLSSDFGVTSITDNGTGDISINFIDAFTSTSYAWFFAGDIATGADNVGSQANQEGKSTTSFRAVLVNSVGTRVDYELWNFLFFGEQ